MENHKKEATTQARPGRVSRVLRGMLGVLLASGAVSVIAMPQAPGVKAVAPIVVESANTTSVEKVLERSEARRLVFVGETHTSLSDHQLQLQVLKAMQAQGGELAIGVEWFQRPFQPVLDRYVRGEIDEQTLLRESEYFDRWGFDFRLYRDILRFAREQGIRILALNTSRELSAAIRKQGLDGLSGEDRGRLPEDYDFNNAEYTEQLKAVFELHQGRDKDDPEAFQRFLEVQLTWDETMAAGVAEYLGAGVENRILVLAGRGHTHEAAIMGRVARRIGLRGLSIASYRPGDVFEQPDFLVLQPSQYLPPSGLIGVGLEERDDQVLIVSISDGSNAGKAGVTVGDRLLEIDGTPIGDYVDVKLAMMDREPGETLSIKLERASFFGLKSQEDVAVTLVPRRPAMH